MEPRVSQLGESLPAQNTRRGDLRLESFHANYSQSVQAKVYDLWVLRRTAGFLCAEVDYGNGEPKPAVIITDLTLEWLGLHWPTMRPEGDPQVWCGKHLGRPRHPARSR